MAVVAGCLGSRERDGGGGGSMGDGGNGGGGDSGNGGEGAETTDTETPVLDNVQHLPKPYNDWTSLGHVDVKGGGLPMYALDDSGEAAYVKDGPEVYQELFEEYREDRAKEYKHDPWNIAIRYPGGQIRLSEELEDASSLENVQQMAGEVFTIPAFTFNIAGPEPESVGLHFSAFIHEDSMTEDARTAPMVPSYKHPDHVFFETYFPVNEIEKVLGGNAVTENNGFNFADGGPEKKDGAYDGQFIVSQNDPADAIYPTVV